MTDTPLTLLKLLQDDAWAAMQKELTIAAKDTLSNLLTATPPTGFSLLSSCWGSLPTRLDSRLLGLNAFQFGKLLAHDYRVNIFDEAKALPLVIPQASAKIDSRVYDSAVVASLPTVIAAYLEFVRRTLATWAEDFEAQLLHVSPGQFLGLSPLCFSAVFPMTRYPPYWPPRDAQISLRCFTCPVSQSDLAMLAPIRATS